MPKSPLITIPLIIMIIHNMLSNLSVEASSPIKTQIQRLAQLVIDSCCVGMQLTTTCSGTDLLCPVLAVLFEACQHCLHTASVHVEHRWSCEPSAWKASWTQRVVGMPHVFRDVADLPKGRADTHVGISQEYDWSLYSKVACPPVGLHLPAHTPHCVHTRPTPCPHPVHTLSKPFPHSFLTLSIHSPHTLHIRPTASGGTFALGAETIVCNVWLLRSVKMWPWLGFR